MPTPTETAIAQLIEWRDHGSGPDANYCAGNQRFADDVTLALGEIERLRSDLALLGPVTTPLNGKICTGCDQPCCDGWTYCPSCGAQGRRNDDGIYRRKR